MPACGRVAAGCDFAFFARRALQRKFSIRFYVYLRFRRAATVDAVFERVERTIRNDGGAVSNIGDRVLLRRRRGDMSNGRDKLAR